MRPLVSILVPAYNAEPWIADTIRSAIGKTWPRREIIVVDDGSIDRTLAVAREFASKDVLVVTYENQGATATPACDRFHVCRGSNQKLPPDLAYVRLPLSLQFARR
jgi:cellulose synthase/poly-beta-1,6-N-acetylglucosamine synthase-like glycosyltransferase